MSYVALGFFILACGWNLYRDFMPTRSRALCIEGHPQYFGAALAAGYVFALAICLHQSSSQLRIYRNTLASIVEMWPKENAPKAESSPDNGAGPQIMVIQQWTGAAAKTSSSHALAGSAGGNVRVPRDKAQIAPQHEDGFAKAVAVSIWAAVLALLLPRLINFPYRANRRLSHLVTYDALEGVERILVDATLRDIAVAVTLDSKKFYVGVPLETDQDGAAETKWIKIRPLASGYRSQEGNFRFTTAYHRIYQQMDSDADEHRVQEDFCVAIPVGQVSSIQHFDLDLYLRRFTSDSADSLDADLGEALSEVLEGEAASDQLNVAAHDIPYWAAAPTEVTSSPTNVHSENDQQDADSRCGTPEVVSTITLPDWLLSSLGWIFIGSVTLAVGALPFSVAVSIGSAMAASIALLALLAESSGKWSNTSRRLLLRLFLTAQRSHRSAWTNRAVPRPR